MRPRSLAVFGAPPRFAAPVHVGRPNVGNREALFARLDGALGRHWLTNDGQLVQELEQRLSAFLGVRHCVLVSSGTIALALAARATGMKGEVIMPAFTFVATAHALEWMGLTPVFCEITPRTHLIDPASAEARITERTGGIVGVHLWGEPCPVGPLAEVARRHGLRLILDAAHAFGAGHSGRMIGSFGQAEAFSFHATKVFNTLEGGAITTDDDDVASEARALRNFGFRGRDWPEGPGTNAKMNEFSAAMGLTNLESFASFVAQNRRNYAAYESGLANVPGVHLLSHHGEPRNDHYIVVEVSGGDGTLERDDLLRVLHAENVLARRYYWPGCHRLKPYSADGSPSMNLPVTDAVARRVLVLPSGTGVTEADVHDICAIIATAMELSDRIAGRDCAARPD